MVSGRDFEDPEPKPEAIETTPGGVWAQWAVPASAGNAEPGQDVEANGSVIGPAV